VISIIPHDCFLRKLPHSLGAAELLSLDAIRAATDMFELSLNRMETLALSISPNIQLAVVRGFMPALFVDAWAAIMNFDAVSEVVKHLEPKIIEVVAFEQTSTQIRSLRNKFQHFPGNISNRSRKKGSRFPQYGAISWTYTPKPEPDRDVSVLFCNMCAHTEQFEIRPVNPAGRTIRRPIGCFQLQAYGIIVEFEQLEEALRRLIDFINTNVYFNINSQMQKYASEHGIKLARMSGNNIGPTAFSLSGFLSDDDSQWTMRAANEQEQPHAGITAVPT
jgi:hypothetical protein